jgi:hypothetical protein
MPNPQISITVLDSTGATKNANTVPAAGIAGTPSTDVNSVQGITNGIPLPVGEQTVIFTPSAVNSTTAQLGAGATFAGAIETCYAAPGISILAVSDQNSTVTVYQYIDAAGTQLAQTLTYTFLANQGFSRCIPANGNYAKVTITNNGGSTTTTLRMDVQYGPLQSVNQLDNRGSQRRFQHVDNAIIPRNRHSPALRFTQTAGRNRVDGSHQQSHAPRFPKDCHGIASQLLAVLLDLFAGHRGTSFRAKEADPHLTQMSGLTAVSYSQPRQI